MRNMICTLLLLVCTAFTAQAQNERVDVFLGYSIVHNGDLPKAVPSNAASVVKDFATLRSGLNIQGASGSVSINANRFFGFVGDLGFQHSAKENLFTFMGGPELSLRTKKNRLFAHAMVGGAYEIQPAELAAFKASDIVNLADSSFAYAVGGGFEKGLAKHIGLRFGVDYIYSEVFHSSDNNLRGTVGFVFK